MDESGKMPWMIIKCDHVRVQGFSWMMLWMIIQGDHVSVQGFSSMTPWMSIQVDHVAVHGFSWMNHGRCPGRLLSQVTMLQYKDFHG